MTTPELKRRSERMEELPTGEQTCANLHILRTSYNFNTSYSNWFNYNDSLVSNLIDVVIHEQGAMSHTKVCKLGLHKRVFLEYERTQNLLSMFRNQSCELPGTNNLHVHHFLIVSSICCTLVAKKSQYERVVGETRARAGVEETSRSDSKYKALRSFQIQLSSWIFDFFNGTQTTNCKS